MNLNETLTMIAAQLKADPQALIAFAAEDTLGGYHWNEALRQFPSGSLWQVEGQILYALIRWLKPEVIAEIGGWAGASASHMAAAVAKNGVGHIYSIDNEVGGMKHGNLLPPEFRDLVTLVKANGEDWLAGQDDGSVGLIFEDADHSTALVAMLTRLALKKIQPGGLLVNHDAAHDFAYIGGGVKINSPVGREVRDGLAQAYAFFKPYLAEPSDCGVAITVIPGVRNLDYSSKPPTAVKSISFDDLKAALQGLSPEEVGRLLQNVKPLSVPEAVQVDGSPLKEYIGSANIESASEPPPVEMLPPQEKGEEGETDEVATPVTKLRKPKAK